MSTKNTVYCFGILTLGFLVLQAGALPNAIVWAEAVGGVECNHSDSETFKCPDTEDINCGSTTIATAENQPHWDMLYEEQWVCTSNGCENQFEKKNISSSCDPIDE